MTVLLGTESGGILETESGVDIRIEEVAFGWPIGPPDIRITVLSPSARAVVILDASSDLASSNWQVQYEKTPGGCGAGSIVFGLRYEEAFERGYATAMNIVEISTGDDILQADCTTGATKLYVTSTTPYSTTAGEATPQIYLWDGATLTMRIPVTGIGADSGGPFITIGSPLAGGGNPTTLPAYSGGATIIGRRRYAGVIALRDRPKQNVPMTTVTLQPLANIFNLTQGSYSVGTTPAIDIGAAMYQILALFGLPGSAVNTAQGGCSAGASSFTVTSAAGISTGTYLMLDYGLATQEIVIVASVVGTTITLSAPALYAHAASSPVQDISRWPHLHLNAANFPDLGVTFTGSRTGSSVMSMLSDLVGAVNTGDVWSVVVDHDRVIKLVRLYTAATNSYAYPVTFTQGQVQFEPLNIDSQDQNIQNLFNAVIVTGAQNPATQQPYLATVVDPSAIVLYDGLQFDATTVSNTSLTSDVMCAQYGQALLNQNAIARQQTTLRIFTRNDYSLGVLPEGLTNGDVVRGTDAVTIVGFDQVGVSANNCPDSEVLVPTLWTTQFGLLHNVNGAGPSGSNAWELSANGTDSASSPPLYAGAGRRFVLSANIDATHVTAGTVAVQLFTNGGTLIASVTQTHGVNGRVSSAPILLPAGATTAQVTFGASGVTLSGGPLVFSQPMLADGGFAKPYVPNYGAPAVFGLVSSATTTLTAHGDRYQDVIFNPIEPDWSTAIAEQGNALAAQLRLNAAAGTSISQYTLSPSFFPLSWNGSSFVVTVPVALAIFAYGTTPVVVGGNTFTLPPSTISWVWLNPNNTYTISGSPTTHAGAILLGFFFTSTTGVFGFTQKASVGVVVLSQSQLPSMGSEAVAAPVLTPPSPTITYPVDNVGNATYDAAATFTVDQDTATIPALVALALFAVDAGDVVDDPRDFPYGPGVPTVQWTGFTLTAVWTGIGAGNSKDLYVAYQDGQGRLSLPTKVGTTNANQAGASALLGVPTTAPNPISPASAFTYLANGGGTYDASCAIALDALGTTANNALAEIECVILPHNPSNREWTQGWVPSGNPQLVNASGLYECAWGGCGVQIAYDVGVRYVGQNGSRSYVYIIGTTTAAQLAQIPFQGVTVDPNSGYIVITDTVAHPTALRYALSAGVGSLLSASWNASVGTTAVSPALWLFSEPGGSGYQMYWFSDGKVYIAKWLSGAATVLATSAVTYTKDTAFHNFEFIASETTSGTVNLTAIIDGTIACQATDSSSPYTVGTIAAQFRDAAATNFIDEKTVLIEMGGSPSSTSVKGQGSILPSSIPQVVMAYNPTGSPVFISTAFFSGTVAANTLRVMPATTTLYYQDGSSLAYTGPANGTAGIGSGGTFYISAAINLATGATVFIVSTPDPEPASGVISTISDGFQAILVNYALTISGSGALNIPGSSGRTF